MYSAILFKDAKNLGLNTVFLLKLVKICKYPELSPFPHDKLNPVGQGPRLDFRQALNSSTTASHPSGHPAAHLPQAEQQDTAEHHAELFFFCI